ncbi:MAG: hypothetical protein U9Q66_01450 [Patescibacteria group bacterium]|nr:hypothetical protein [Patescibacteria group bacterium]
MKELSSISKLEHIIYLVREYEKDIVDQRRAFSTALDANAMIISTVIQFGGDVEDAKLNPVPSITPQAEVYLERIEAFLSKD